MNTKKVITIVIVILVILGITGAVYYSKNKGLSGENGAASAADAANIERFNASMKNARMAFANGDYKTSLSHYNQALKYKSNDDTAYAGLFTVYGAQENWKDAMNVLDKAIEINPLYTDYWKWKISALDEKMNMEYDGLKNVYDDGLKKVYKGTKINLITHFAGIAERNGEKDDAIAAWEAAKVEHPERASIYQEEINRLKSAN